MNLRSTTPAHDYFRIARIALFMLFVIGFLAASTQPSQAISNQERQKRIDELTTQIDKQVQDARKLNSQNKSAASQIAALKRERDYLQKQMVKNQQDQITLSESVANTAKAIKLQQDILGTIMADAYVDGTISPLEMLASSRSVADFIDKQTYQNAISHQLSNSLTKIKNMKKQLIADQAQLKQIAGEQYNQSLALTKQQKDQEALLVVSEGKGAKLTRMTAKMAQEKKQLQTSQQQVISSFMVGAEQVSDGTLSTPDSDPTPPRKPIAVAKPPTPIAKPAPTPPSVQTPGPAPAPKPTPKPAPSKPTPAPAPKPKPAPPKVILRNGGYPNYLNNCYVDSNALSYGIDPWGYGCRQCVSYTAWKVLQKTGRAAMYWGNAKQWPASARRAGYRTGSAPRVKSVAVMTSGYYGHVAWVESINSNGTLNISQYNYWLPNKANGGWGYYSEFRNVSPRAYQTYIYI